MKSGLLLRHVNQVVERLLYRLHQREFQQQVVRAIACVAAVVASFGLAIWFDASMWTRNIAAFFSAMLVFLVGAIVQRSLR